MMYKITKEKIPQGTGAEGLKDGFRKYFSFGITVTH